MKIVLAFLLVCLVCFLIFWNVPRPNFSEKYGFPCLGQTIRGKFYVNPARLKEVNELYEEIKEGKPTTLSEKEKETFVRGVDEWR